MSEYVRPAFAPRTFMDADGRVIAYGSRWGLGSPPDDSYSVTSNLERFDPLDDVADALVDWLTETFDVSRDDHPATTLVVPHPREDVARAVRLTPRDPEAAALTVVWTSFPGVRIRAGVMGDFAFPVCGCDACDEDVVLLADDLERTVRTIVGGGFSETFDPDRELAIGFSLRESGVGARSGQSRAEGVAPGLIAQLRRRRDWAAWSPA